MFDKLDFIVSQYNDLSLKISDPAIIEDQDQWQVLIKEHAQIRPIVEKYLQYSETKREMEGAQELLEDTKDEELQQMAKEEISELKNSIELLEEELKFLLLPKDPNDEKDVIFEVRAGAGGDEAGLFASELLRLYQRFAEKNRWKFELLNLSDNGIGGIKEASVLVKGNGVYSRLKYESGTHRVQRIPQTESGGRIHTSTATIAILPDVDDVEIEIAANDIRIDTYRSSGNGGQSVNTTDSAVRITHFPSGLVVSCQDGKSQHDNKSKAMQVLKARLYDIEQAKIDDEIAQQRRSQVGTGDRSAKIRTYNFPQARVTDHRIPITIYKLDSYMEGDIDDMIDQVAEHYKIESLKQMESN